LRHVESLVHLKTALRFLEAEIEGTESDIAVLCGTHHHQAVAFETIGELSSALQAYEEADTLAEDFFPMAHPVRETFHVAYAEARERLEVRLPSPPPKDEAPREGKASPRGKRSKVDNIARRNRAEAQWTMWHRAARCRVVNPEDRMNFEETQIEFLGSVVQTGRYAAEYVTKERIAFRENFVKAAVPVRRDKHELDVSTRPRRRHLQEALHDTGLPSYQDQTQPSQQYREHQQGSQTERGTSSSAGSMHEREWEHAGTRKQNNVFDQAPRCSEFISFPPVPLPVTAPPKPIESWAELGHRKEPHPHVGSKVPQRGS